MKLLLFLLCLLIVCVLYMKYRDNNRELFEGYMFYRYKEENLIYI